MNEENENPVTSGLVALVAVAIVVGLLGGIIALVGTKVVGLGGGGGSSSGDGVAVGDSLYMPDPEPTELDSRLLVTLQPTETEEETSATASAPETTETTTEPSGDTALTLSTATYDIAVGDPLTLSGIYENGEGSVLEVWNNVNGGGWQKFNATTNVSGSLFSVDVITYQAGEIEWQVRDPDSGTESNVITVQHTDEYDAG